MISIRDAHVVVVGDGDRGPVLVARLRRMGLARVTAISGFAEAVGLCQRGEADVCVVMFADTAPDAMPIAVNDAPGRSSGVPSLMVVPAATPFLRKTARHCGYLAVVPATIAPRMLFRRICAALQQRRAARRARRHGSGGLGMPFFVAAPALGKPTLH